MKILSPVLPVQAAFTLLEMLCVLAIIAILALFSLPSYLHRNVRLQIEGALSLADIPKARVAEQYASLQTFPIDNAAADLPVPEKYVSLHIKSLSINDGVIHLRFGNSAHPLLQDKVISLRPAVVSDAPIVPVAWICDKAKVPDKMTVRGENQTSVPQEFMPLFCLARK
jgi:type IV pilus assembly protein PilA